ncbi:pyruvate kinase [Thecamonas trahens ATCC 50062]|uniref:Pyruvate kinase n=1 Tax=Thecamonas trahens ATCC 50062 TaxID=461836 RepID=A0A0L0DUT3_THETB|nr:pyruvate kinase [Thecamonas trahens ATCC 50062]KNC55268.1 pyruvate kinase [Thecamonas trahens ATCC 50062]|eukprot:XP_013753091.1 pyruvate kinase [Thecamonas trahens ATCC 50062]
MAATSENPLKRKLSADVMTEDMTPTKRAKVRAFYMSETYGQTMEVPFSAEVRTKIICTIGPASANEAMIRGLVMCGMSVARLNFSHGKHEWFAEVIATVRRVAAELNRTVAVMLDTKGPEVRTCSLAGGESVMLHKDTTFTLLTDTSVDGDDTRVATTYPGLPQSVEVGDYILIDDGLIRLRVTEVHTDSVVTTVLNSGQLGQNKGVNLPGKEYDLPAVTAKDRADIAFGVEQNVDIIAASFIRNKANVDEVRALPGVADAGIHIVSKIESTEGLTNFDEILAASDGIMVARGDLGVEIPIEKVCNEQKKMISKCNQAGKPVITATQMLDSMIRNPRPTRAECTDVANAVFDGTDCVMLSGETASGLYPLEAVQVMARICVESEAALSFRERFEKTRATQLALTPVINHAEAIASSAVKTATDIGAKLIVVLTETGRTARLLSKYFPEAVILAITASPKTAAQLLLTRSVTPIKVNQIDVNDNVIRAALFEAVDSQMIESGDAVVVVSGTIVGQSGATNTLRTLVVP